MKQFLTRFAAAFLLLLVGFIFAGAQTAPLEGFDAYVEKALKDWEVPGVAIAVVKDDKIVLAKGYGVKEIGKPEKIDERTIFGVASNSKAFTAAAIAMLVDEGKLNWDGKVTKYLPEYQLFDPWVTREITIRDLLSHRSGLPAYGGDILWWGGDYSRDEIIRRVRFVRPQTSFRSRFAYQNIPFITAGKIVERVSGKTWEEFIKERFFAPLGMKDSTVSIKDFTASTNKTTPHFRDVETGKTISVKWRNLDAGAPAAGINSNVVDMAQWVRLQLNGGKFEGKQLIGVRQIQQMQSPQMLLPFSNPADQPKQLNTNFSAYGLGWFLKEYAGYKMVSHGGSTDGMLTQVAFLPELKLGVVVLTNIHNRSFYTPIVNRVFDAFIGKEQIDWSAYYLKKTEDGEKQEMATFQTKLAERVKDSQILPLAAYAGTYENELYGKISFADENGKLVVRLSHSPTFIGDLEHWHFNTFRVVWRDPIAEKTFLTFTVGDDGKAESVKMAMTSFIDDAEYEYKRTDN